MILRKLCTRLFQEANITSGSVCCISWIVKIQDIHTGSYADMLNHFLIQTLLLLFVTANRLLLCGMCDCFLNLQVDSVHNLRAHKPLR